MDKKATISECGQYRYQLSRSWDVEKPRVLFVMLNPSTADAEIDDATIRSCIRLCKSWDYGGLEVVNLFAFRATKPKDMDAAPDPIGPQNDEYIQDAIARTDFTVCAWGAHKAAIPRAKHVVGLIRQRRDFAHCLGVTKAGAPKHPLYIKTGTTPQVYTL